MLATTNQFQAFTIIVAAFISTISLTGCLTESSPDSSSNHDENNSDPQNTESIDSTNLADLSMCLTGGTSITRPDEKINDDEFPEGWRYSSFAAPLHVMDLFICDRFSVGPYERSNVTMLVEYDFGPLVPDSCIEATNSDGAAEWVRGVWVDDSEIAAWLTENYSMPASTFEFSVFHNQSGPIVYRAEWKISGNQNYLNFIGTPDDEPTDLPARFSFFWASENGVAALIMENEIISQDGSVTAAEGNIQPPHYNPNHNGNWIGGADMATQSHFAEFYSFEDSLCEQPSS